jgi:glycosyltransferase involved in cell wall biosynthesis
MKKNKKKEKYFFPSALPRKALPTEDQIKCDWRIDADCRVSVVCHAYNHESFIEQALVGFLSQRTQFPFEIIVHDDASTDNTVKIIERYQAAYPDIIRTVFQKKNQYRLGMRPPVFTFPLARGDYIALCEGDDYWCDEYKLSKQVAVLDQNPSAVMCYHDAIRVSEEGRVVGYSRPSRGGYSASQLASAPFIPTLTRMFRNKPIHWLERRPLPVALDIVLTSYLSRFGGAVYVNDIAPAVYHVHDGGMWSRKGAVERLRTTLDAVLFIAARYEEEGDTRSSHLLITRAVSEFIGSVGSAMVAKVLMRRLLEQLRARLKRLLIRLNPDL